MAGYLYSGLNVYVKHEPDFSLETGADGLPVSQELPGFVEFGVECEGVWVPLLRRKAAGFFADVERAKQSPTSTSAATASTASSG